jgi:hypothetical protein
MVGMSETSSVTPIILDRQQAKPRIGKYGLFVEVLRILVLVFLLFPLSLAFGPVLFFLVGIGSKVGHRPHCVRTTHGSHTSDADS